MLAATTAEWKRVGIHVFSDFSGRSTMLESHSTLLTLKGVVDYTCLHLIELNDWFQELLLSSPVWQNILSWFQN